MPVHVYIKGEAVPLHTMKLYRWSRSTAHQTLNLRTRWESGQLHAPPALSPGNETSVPTEQGGSHSVWMFWRISCVCLQSNPRSPIPKPSHYTNYATVISLVANFPLLLKQPSVASCNSPFASSCPCTP